MSATPVPPPPAAGGLLGLVDRILGLVLNKSYRASPGGQEYWKRAIDAQHGWPTKTAATAAMPSPPTKPADIPAPPPAGS